MSSAAPRRAQDVDARFAAARAHDVAGRSGRAEALYRQIRAACPAEADGILIAGTGFRCVAIVEALERAGMRENTLIVFSSDNGGTRDKMFAGEGAVSGELPADNGPYRGGKGSLYEGGTRVVALANWPGRIAPGVVDGMMHMVDMYPTLAALAGADTSPSKPLDGMDVWLTLSRNDPSPRVEVVHNVESYRGAVRQGDWKVVWLSLLPPSVELFDLADDPAEAQNQAAISPAVAEELQARIVKLAGEAAPALFISETLRIGLSGKPAFPDGNLANIGAYQD